MQLAKGYNSSIIISLGYKSDEELLAYFSECNFVVLPYKEASQSGVLLTALSLGKPVIATKVGALPEVVNIVKLLKVAILFIQIILIYYPKQWIKFLISLEMNWLSGVKIYEKKLSKIILRII